MSARSSLIIVFVVALITGGCRAELRNGPLKPAAPGPFDLVYMLFGNYSTLCPRDYEYCHGGAHSNAICCPLALRCCQNTAGAPICCAPPVPQDHEPYLGRPHGQDADEVRQHDDGYLEAPPERSSCLSADLACSQGTRRVCCSPRDGCCVDEHGPYC